MSDIPEFNGLQEEEITLTNHLLKTNGYKLGQIKTTYESLESELEIKPKKSFQLFQELAKKSVLNLKSLPVPHETVLELLFEILEFDTKSLFSNLQIDNYEQQHRQLSQKLQNIITFDKRLTTLIEQENPINVLETCSRIYDALSFLDRIAAKEEHLKSDISDQNSSIGNDVPILLSYSKTLGSRLDYIHRYSLTENIRHRIENSIRILTIPHFFEHIYSIQEELNTLIARKLVGELDNENYSSNLQNLLRNTSSKNRPDDNKILEKIKEFEEKEFLDNKTAHDLKNLLSQDSISPTGELDISDASILVELIEKADGYIPRCPKDKKILDGTFQTIKCTSCGSEYCLLPCAESIIDKKGKCPNCGRPGFSKLEYHIYMAKLEKLRSEGKIGNDAFEKLKKEYEMKI